MVRRALVAAALLVGAVHPVAAQRGLLVVAHGAGREWNDRVRETLAQVEWAQGPSAVAFLMGAEKDSAGWNAGVARLVREGAQEIVVVPLMISSHGSHYRQIRYYAGELDALPAELAGHDHHAGAAARPVPMRVTPALDAAPELALALAARWAELDARDRERPLLLVAHGPNSAADAERWIADITAVSAGLRKATGRELQVALLRDDAPAAVRARAVSDMRDSVLAMAERARDSVVAMPVMISQGTITHTKIPRDLANLPLRYRPEPLAPLAVLARWIERSAATALADRGES